MRKAHAPPADWQAIAALGDQIYEREISPRVTPEDRGKFVAIDVSTGAYEVDSDEVAASDRLYNRCPDAQVWLRRVGFRYAHRFGLRAVTPAP